eukprot:1008103-Rhodomonas_salina.1
MTPATINVKRIGGLVPVWDIQTNMNLQTRLGFLGIRRNSFPYPGTRGTRGLSIGIFIALLLKPDR